MKTNLDLIRELDWRNDERVQEHAIEQLVNRVAEEELSLLVQPFEDKALWENAATVLMRIGYPRVGKILPELLGWLEDLNWPGSREIFRLLLSVDSGALVVALECALREAERKSDYMWIAAMSELVSEKKLANLTPEMERILALSELA